MWRPHNDMRSDAFLFTETGEERNDLISDSSSLTKKARRQLPKELSQATFMEARNASIAIADGAMLRRWQVIKGEIALTHLIEDEPLQVKFTAPEYLTLLGHATTYESLRNELQTLSPQGVLLFHISIGLALQERHATLEIDELIRLLGWSPRSRKERSEMRWTVYRWLLIFDAMTVIGKRPGKYCDPVTKEVLDLTCRSVLVKITETDFTKERAAFDHSEPPVRVTLTAGPFLEKFRGNRQVLQDFGNVLKLARLPTGKPSGAWALSIGLTLNQLWRQGAGYAQVNRANGKPNVSFKYPFTRYRLLDMFRPDLARVEDVLGSQNPKRAQQYWDEAIELLTEHKVIGGYSELDKLPQKRMGWQGYWLKNQRLEIKPNEEGVKAVLELTRQGAKAKRAVKRPSTRPSFANV
jgi:hypothetical protein